jgi:Trk-type K+ transport system membrane component
MQNDRREARGQRSEVRDKKAESYKKRMSRVFYHGQILMYFLFFFTFHLSPSVAVHAHDLILNDLIEEALKNSPELLISETKVTASGHKIPQAKSLPDPMFMFGYQNEGFNKFTLGEEPDAYGMFSLSQMFFCVA